MSTGVRLDKWLWAVRLTKTRGVAAEACAAGKVKRADHSLKASATVRVGDVLEFRFPEGPGTRTVLVTSVIEKRVGAPEAQACYEDRTPEETLETRRLWQEARRMGGKGRPTKRDRRDLDRIQELQG